MAKKKKQPVQAKRGSHVAPKKKGWRLYVPKGDRYHKAALLQTFRSMKGTFAVFRIEG
jgi:hypothetical protein